MSSDEYYWFAGDGELRCALESFCAASPPQLEEDHLQACPRKRSLDEACTGSKSKSCREKIRRDKLNERFLELSSILDPNRPPRADKAGILGDAARALVELRSEAQELKKSNAKLQEAIKYLKAEKNEIRDEKARLKADRERLEHQIKVMTAVPPATFLPHPIAFHPIVPATAAFTTHDTGRKSGHFAAYPSAMGMWHWLPTAVRDTTQDTKLWPPSA